MQYIEFSTTKYTPKRFYTDPFLDEIDRIGKYRYRAGCEDKNDVRRTKRFCKKMNCRIVSTYTENEKRGTDYRKTYFQTHPMPEGGYRCRYCGKRLSRETLEVDHIFPIDLAKRKGIPFYLRNQGITNINDPENLAAACHRCNSRKSNKAGIWLIKAWLGKYPWWHIVRKIVIIAFSLAVLLAVMYLSGLILSGGDPFLSVN